MVFKRINDIVRGGPNVILLNEIAKTSTSIYGTLKKKIWRREGGGGGFLPNANE